MSISKFQNLTYEEVNALDDRFNVVLIDEAHRFRNHGKWNPNPVDDDDYTGTRRHANARLLRNNTMIMLTATPLIIQLLIPRTSSGCSPTKTS